MIRAIRQAAIFTALIMFLVYVLGWPAHAGERRSMNNLVGGSCGEIALTNGGTNSFANSNGVGHVLTLGGSNARWCVARLPGSLLKFHHRVSGKSSNQVIAVQSESESESPLILQPNGTDNGREQWGFHSQTGRDDWERFGGVVFTFGDGFGDVLRSGQNLDQLPWTNWTYICETDC